ncbi:carboxypeptidase-like regulatory domain-containing protein [Fibrella sp. ES10-3-2-2]
MNQPAVVTIPTPCSEPWERMTTVSGGRHCAACQKTVHDFSTFSDRELANWLATYNGGAVCGRLRTDQLERSIQPVQIRSQPNHGSWVRWAVALVLGWQTAKGQNKQPTVDFSIPLVPATETTLSNSLTTATAAAPDQPVTYTITGKVIDEDKLPISGGFIVIKGTKKGVDADQDGNFTLSVTQKDEFASTVLIFGFIGYKSQEVTVTGSKRDSLLITLQASEELLGEVIITGPHGNFFHRSGLSPKKSPTKQK